VPEAFRDSPIFPLPADYEELTEDGQREARLNACRLWTAEDAQPGDLVASLRFFDLYYLHPDPHADFDPLFYDMPPRETPEFHWALVRQWAQHRLCAAIAPRGGAKSTLLRKKILLQLVTGTAFSVVYATSTHDNAKHTGQIIKDQAFNNQRIADDFGDLKPSRGEKPTGVEYFHLNNGAYLRCLSAESRIRGIRPRLFAIDDPEYDEKASTSMALIRTYMEKLLFRLCVPMVMRSNCGINWLGTFVSKRHYLWHAMSTVSDPSTGKAMSLDPRFNYWSRLWVRAAMEDPSTGQVVSCWPDMWPATIAEKKARGTPTLVSLEEMKQMMGSAAFNAEMLGRPGDLDEQFFKLDQNPRGRHAFWYEDADIHLSTDPRASSARICWLRKNPDITVTMPLTEFLGHSRLFITVDTAFTESTHSDRRVCTLMACTPQNELFVLDMWSDRANDTVLMRKTLEIANRWRCPMIFVEVVRESFKLYQMFLSAVSTGLTKDMGFTFAPAIRDIRPGTMEKAAKIAALEPRFEWSLIKLPFDSRASNPGIRRLFDQVEGFNPDANDGGLDHDDELDTISMSLMALKGRLPTKDPGQLLETTDPFEMIKKGVKMLPGGASIVSGMPLQMLSAESISKLLEPDTFLPDSSTSSSETRV